MRTSTWTLRGAGAVGGALALLLFLQGFVGCTAESDTPWSGAAGDAIVSEWNVTTTLVAAQDPTNQDYKPGDLRQTRWRVTASGSGLVLQSPEGTLPGQLQGANFVFEGVRETGMNLRIQVRIEGFLTSASRMIGTIKANYHGTYDNLVGIDAWTFEATR